MSDVDVAVIVLSYNRPRMLAEALGSIRGAAQIIVADDGSDFDPREVIMAAELPMSVDIWVVREPRISVEARLTTPRTGALLNWSLTLVTCPIVTYLCDDDLFDPGWPAAAAAWLDAHPDQHVVAGDWYEFDDGEAPGSRPCSLDTRGLTTGNFAHRLSCVRDEGLRWSEGTVVSHDDQFAWGLLGLHGLTEAPRCGAPAGWRRLHRHNAIHYARGHGYAPGAEALFAGTWLE